MYTYQIQRNYCSCSFLFSYICSHFVRRIMLNTVLLQKSQKHPSPAQNNPAEKFIGLSRNSRNAKPHSNLGANGTFLKAGQNHILFIKSSLTHPLPPEFIRQTRINSTTSKILFFTPEQGRGRWPAQKRKPSKFRFIFQLPKTARVGCPMT